MIDIKSVALGVTLSVLLAGGMVVALFFFSGPQVRSISHKVVLPSGKTVEVTMCNFAWGVEHAERDVQKDSFVLEYVSTVPHTDLAAVDRETLEVFELIRPVSELWGLDVANVSAFPTVDRRGKYFIYLFSQDSGGNWTFQRKEAKVFIND
ncbi:MAG: hypothetical protein V9H26_04600 [Verrucomicrobiota bacterium]|jgi:hypothetical protein